MPDKKNLHFVILLFVFMLCVVLSTLVTRLKASEDIYGNFLESYLEESITKDFVLRNKPFEEKANISSNIKFVRVSGDIEIPRFEKYIKYSPDYAKKSLFERDNVFSYLPSENAIKVDYAQMYITPEKYLEYLEKYVKNLGGTFQYYTKVGYTIPNDHMPRNFFRTKEDAEKFIEDFYKYFEEENNLDYKKLIVKDKNNILKRKLYDFEITVPEEYQEFVEYCPNKSKYIDDGFLKTLYNHLAYEKINRENVEKGFVIQ